MRINNLKEKFKKTQIHKLYAKIYGGLINKGQNEISKSYIKSFIKTESPTILEIGANNGKDSLEFLNEFKKIELHCFEPDPRQIKNFKSRIIDKRCTLHEIGLSNQKGIFKFYLSESKDPTKNANDSSSLKKPKKHLKRFPWISFKKDIKIKTETLDSWTKKNKIKEIDFIWADVQGTEKELIEGGLNTLNKKVKYFYTEFYNEELYEGQISLKEILILLPNFRLVKIYGNNALLKNISMFKENYIISAAQGGISNRIMCLLSSMKISDNSNKKLLLYWPKDYSCNSNFNELFENKISQISKDKLRKLIKNKNISINGLNKKFNLIEDTNLKPFSKKDIHHKFEKISKKTRKDILNYLMKINVRKDLIKTSEIFLKKINKNFIGVQIRKGDFLNLKNGAGLVSPDNLFIKEMENEISKNPKVKFFISTEDKKTEEKFKEVFGDRVCFYPKKINKREDEGSVREALIDLLILSRASKIFATYGSTFSEMAWFFGGCKSKVRVLIDKKRLENYNSLSKKIDHKMFLKIKKKLYKLIYPLDKRILDRK